MVLVFGGFLAASMPMAGAIASISGGLAALLAFSYVIDLDSSVVNIVTVLGLGLSIDYGLLIVSRFREELHRLVDEDDGRASRRRRGDGAVLTAIERTMATAGRTVTFSALTVAIAIAGLLVFEPPILRAFGAAGRRRHRRRASLSALTLVPALMALAGRRLIRPERPRPRARAACRAGPHVGRADRGGRVLAADRAGAAPPVVGARRHRRRARRARHPARPPRGAQLDHRAAARGQHPAASSSSILASDYPAASTPADHGRRRDLARRRRPPGPRPSRTSTASRPSTPPTAGRLLRRDRRAARHRRPGRRDVARSVVAGDPRPRRALPDLGDGQAASQIDFTAAVATRAPWAIAHRRPRHLRPAVPHDRLRRRAGQGAAHQRALAGRLARRAWSGCSRTGTCPGCSTSRRPAASRPTSSPSSSRSASGWRWTTRCSCSRGSRSSSTPGVPNDEAVRLGMQRSGRIITSAALIVIVVFAGFVAGKLLVIKEVGFSLAVAVLIDATIVRLLLVPATMTAARPAQLVGAARSCGGCTTGSASSTDRPCARPASLASARSHGSADRARSPPALAARSSSRHRSWLVMPCWCAGSASSGPWSSRRRCAVRAVATTWRWRSAAQPAALAARRAGTWRWADERRPGCSTGVTPAGGPPSAARTTTARPRCGSPAGGTGGGPRRSRRRCRGRPTPRPSARPVRVATAVSADPRPAPRASARTPSRAGATTSAPRSRRDR